MEDLEQRSKKVFDFLEAHGIKYEVYFHPESPTIEIAKQYWREDGSVHCKNLFFRNHKGNNPVLIRIDTNAGHGAGKPTSKRIEETADTFAFVFENTKTEYKR